MLFNLIKFIGCYHHYQVLLGQPLSPDDWMAITPQQFSTFRIDEVDDYKAKLAAASANASSTVASGNTAETTDSVTPCDDSVYDNEVLEMNQVRMSTSMKLKEALMVTNNKSLLLLLTCLKPLLHVLLSSQVMNLLS